MLILTRRVGETIMIGDNVSVTITAIKEDRRRFTRVHVGVNAPKDIAVHREEVYDLVKSKHGEVSDGIQGSGIKGSS